MHLKCDILLFIFKECLMKLKVAQYYALATPRGAACPHPQKSQFFYFDLQIFQNLVIVLINMVIDS